MSESRRLGIAGTLWKLTKDPVFVDLLNAGKVNGTLMAAHMFQLLWLGDARAVDFLIDLLGHFDRTTRFFALQYLNLLESGHGEPAPPEEPSRQPDYYGSRRNDPAFREPMTAAVRKWNDDRKGRGLGRV